MTTKRNLLDLLDTVRAQVEAGAAEQALVAELQSALTDLQEQLRQVKLQRQFQAALELARQAGFESIEAFAAAARGAVQSSDAKPLSGRSFVQPQYRDPRSGQTWSGRGRPAAWLQEQAKRKAAAEGTTVDVALETLKSEYRIRR